MDETVEVPIATLKSIQEGVGAVHSYLQADDLANQYRKLDNRLRRSPLTLVIETALANLNQLIEG